MCLQQEIPLTSSSHFVFPPSLYSITLVYRLNGFTELTEAKYVQIWDILNKFYWTIPWISCSILANTPKQSNSKVHTKKAQSQVLQQTPLLFKHRKNQQHRLNIQELF